MKIYPEGIDLQKSPANIHHPTSSSAVVSAPHCSVLLAIRCASGFRPLVPFQIVDAAVSPATAEMGVTGSAINVPSTRSSKYEVQMHFPHLGAENYSIDLMRHQNLQTIASAGSCQHIITI
jgi:hypothetical protein